MAMNLIFAEAGFSGKMWIVYEVLGKRNRTWNRNQILPSGFPDNMYVVLLAT